MAEFVDTQNLIASLESSPRDATAAEIARIITLFRFNESVIKGQVKEINRLADKAREAWMARDAALEGR